VSGAGLPLLGDGSEMASNAERRLGDRIARELYHDPDYIDDPVLWDYVQGVWQPLLVAARQRGDLTPELDERFAWKILLGRDRTVNAFALPGGYLGLNLGLLAVVSSRDELASVLGHELSHVTQRHISRLVSKNNQQAPWMIGAMILGALAASKNAEAGKTLMVGGQALAAQSQLNFSRDMEREADRLGFGVMTQAGFEPIGFVTMFDKLQQASRLNDNGAYPYLRSHPLTENRVADTRNRARQYPLQEPTASLDYQLMRARVTNQLAASPVEAANKFRGELAGTPRSAEAANYGLVLALTAAGKANEARLTLDGIWSRDPERIEYIIADARIDMARRKPEQAVAKLEARLKLTPGNFPLTMAYADALMADGKAHVAEPVLVAQSQLNPNDPGLWYLLAEIQGLSGNIVGLHQSRAEYFILNGNLDQAEKQLSYALKLTRGDFLNSAKITQRLADIAEMRAQMDT